MGIEENRPRNNIEKNVNLPSGEVAAAFNQEVLGIKGSGKQKINIQ